MAHDIKIYGEIVPFQEKWITDQGGYVNLTVVQDQLKEANGEDIRVRIKSYGGDVEEGFSIYSELRRYAKENNAKVTTLAEGQCASIATVFFLAGDDRLVTEFTQPFVHNAWCYVMDGNSKTLSRVSADLEKVNEMIANHYANHTELTYDEARLLMDEETYISPDECVRIRFATAIEEVHRPAALQQKFNKSNNVKMANNSKKVQTQNHKSKNLVDKLMQFFAKDVFTADNQILDFYEKEDNETVTVGDKANLDGKPAEGEVIIANGDKYIFEAGILTEIVEAEAEQPNNLEDPAEGGEGADETQKLKDRIAELETELEEKDNKIEELEDMLEKASNKMNHQETVIKNFKDTASKFAGDQRKENKGNGGKEADKPNVSEAVKNFRQNKLNKK